MKLPMLIEHFNEHKEKDNALSLWGFLTMHYSQEDDHDGDKDEDMKLPFKSHDGCLNSMSLALLVNNSTDITTKSFPLTNAFYGFYTESFILSTYPTVIWQPPKLLS